MIRIAALCLACGLGGCARLPPTTPPPGISAITSPAAQEPLRIAVFPPWLAAEVPRSAGVAGEALAAALREHGRHQVAAAPLALRDEIFPSDPVGANRVASTALVAARERTAADAVLLARIEQYRPYDPILMGLTLHLVSCHDGSVLWSATAVLDGQRFDVQADIERWWAQATGDATPPLNGWRQTLQSPSQFARYAAWRMVATIDPPPPERPVVGARRR